ncbi:MAG: hypothetical protein AABY22_07235, partial [Nanoarchaeota archaeon]
EYISKYLKKHPGVPDDARLEPERVEIYLDRLKDIALIDKVVDQGYFMHSELVRLLSSNVERIKTPEMDEGAIRGISLFASWDSPAYRR